MLSACKALERVPERAHKWPPAWLLEDDVLTLVPVAVGRAPAAAPTPPDDTETFGPDDGDPTPGGHAAPFVVVTDAAGLEPVLAALADTTLVGLDTETTGLNPRIDRLRLLTLTTDTCDGGRIVYVVDAFHVDLQPLFEPLAER